MISGSLLSHMETLISRSKWPPVVVEVRIEPNTFQPLSPALYQLSYPAYLTVVSGQLPLWPHDHVLTLKLNDITLFFFCVLLAWEWWRTSDASKKEEVRKEEESRWWWCVHQTQLHRTQKRHQVYQSRLVLIASSLAVRIAHFHELHNGKINNNALFELSDSMSLGFHSVKLLSIQSKQLYYPFGNSCMVPVPKA
jgi:hypothetical protein